jgi:predicted HicB family RNase H-like nuclease
MKNILEYEGFYATIQYSTEDDIFFGTIEGIGDSVSFEGNSTRELKKAFQEAVEDYQDICLRENKPVYKSYKGSFNVRITPELHRLTEEKAKKEGLSLNQMVQRALEHELKLS